MGSSRQFQTTSNPSSTSQYKPTTAPAAHASASSPVSLSAKPSNTPKDYSSHSHLHSVRRWHSPSASNGFNFPGFSGKPHLRLMLASLDPSNLKFSTVCLEGTLSRCFGLSRSCLLLAWRAASLRCHCSCSFGVLWCRSWVLS